MKKKSDKKEKVLLHEFQCTMYPRKIWIAVTRSCPESLDNIVSMEDCSIADTQAAVDKENMDGGVLIRFANKACMTSPIIAHESVHAAICICDYIGGKINFDSQEFFAYLVEWIVKCCESVKEYKGNGRKKVDRNIEG